VPNNSDEREALQDLLDQREHHVGIELAVPQVRFWPREQLMPLDGRRISGTGHKGFAATVMPQCERSQSLN